jgi:hypothetical protein
MKRGDLIEVRWDGGRWKQGTVCHAQEWWETDQWDNGHKATLLKVLWHDDTEALVRADYVETRLCK